MYFSKLVYIAPNAPVTTGIINTSFMLHIVAISSLSTLYFSNFPTFYLFTHTSPGLVASTILTSFMALSITTISGRRASILVSHWIVKSYRIFYPSFSITPSDSCSYHYYAPWKPCFFAYSPMNIPAYTAMPLFIFLLGRHITITHNMWYCLVFYSTHSI